MATAYAFSRYERKLGEKTGSPSILADSQHFRTDVMASGVVFVSILGSAVGVPLDRIGAIGVVGFIVYAGWELLVDGMRVLLDASLDWKTMEKVERLIAADPDVVKIKSLEGRNAGRYRFIEATIVVDVKDLESAHRVSERVETSIKRGIPRVERVLIHYEPQEKAIVRWAIPVDESKEMVSPHLGKAPFFTLIDLKKSTGEVVGRKTVVNPYLNVEKQKGILVAQFLVSEGVDGLVLRAVLEDKGPRFVLSGAGVQTLVTDIEEAEAVIEELRRRRGEAQQAQ
jgi:predicted Fe-Mo cluster-binding NifX family protein